MLTLGQLKRGPFGIGDLVLMWRPQAPKGQSPFTGPLRMIKVLRRYFYQFSDGQKWNVQFLKHYLRLTTTWAKFLPVLQMLEAIETLLGE